MYTLKDFLEVLDEYTNFYLFNDTPNDYRAIGMFCKTDLGLEPYLNRKIKEIGVSDEMLEIEIEDEK